MPRPADRRAKIDLLRAAEAVFVEHGLTAAKVEDITARAGVSKGAFYLHFASKEDCFRQIVEAFLAKLASCLDEAPPTAEVDGVAKWAEHIDDWYDHDVEMFDFCWQNRGLMSILFTGGGGGPYGYLVDEFAERVGHQIEVWARHLMSVGVYRSDLDPEVFPALIAGGYDRMIREMIKRPRRPDIEGWARQGLDIYMRGVLTDEARAVVDREVTPRAPRRRPPWGASPPMPPTPSPIDSLRSRASGPPPVSGYLHQREPPQTPAVSARRARTRNR
jgi:AcrR family transcriptional regulator